MRRADDAAHVHWQRFDVDLRGEGIRATPSSEAGVGSQDASDEVDRLGPHDDEVVAPSVPGLPRRSCPS
jgi:hypothetical protein